LIAKNQDNKCGTRFIKSEIEINSMVIKERNERQSHQNTKNATNNLGY
jgi:hypothetical protein